MDLNGQRADTAMAMSLSWGMMEEPFVEPDGTRTPHHVRNAVIDVSAAYVGYKAGGALADRYARRKRRMDPGLKTGIITFVALGTVALLVWVVVLGYQGFNATR